MNLVRSKDVEKLETIKKFCLSEMDRLKIIKLTIDNEDMPLTEEAVDFDSFLKVGIKGEYELRSKHISGKCDTCESWKRELEELSK